MSRMAELLLGPLLRYVSETEATVWVETDEPCEVEILGRREPTFRVDGHHYALVRIEGLEPGGRNEYEVALDGERALAGARLRPAAERDPHPRRRTSRSTSASAPAGSPSRTSAPYTRAKDDHEDGHEVDALRVLAAADGPRRRATTGPSCSSCSATRSTSTRARRETRERRSATGAAPTRRPARRSPTSRSTPGSTSESWSDPLIRWLFSTVSVSMLWDDHDMSDDWNISRSWLEEMRQQVLVAPARDRLRS